MWEEGFYKDLRPFDSFVEAVQLCIERNPSVQVYILSAYLDTEPPFVRQEKIEWLRKHLPQLPEEHMIFVPAGADKAAYLSGVSANCYLIDDYNKNLREWEAGGGTAIKFINDINNKGLGAYGDEKGRMWDGRRIDYNNSAMEICLEIEYHTAIKIHTEKQEEQRKYNKRQQMYK